MSADVQLMSRSVAVEEAFPLVPFEEVRNNDTAKAYSAFHRPCNRGGGPFRSFLAWLRAVVVDRETGRVRPRRLLTTVAVGVRYRGVSSDGFIGQLCTMLLPHGGPEAFAGGPVEEAMLPHLLGCRCLVGALV